MTLLIESLFAAIVGCLVYFVAVKDIPLALGMIAIILAYIGLKVS